jgi:hypothetical protein
MEPVAPRTLYEALSAPAPEGIAAGETVRTLSKETLDADNETLLLGLMLDA